MVTPQGTIAGQYHYSPYGKMTVSGSTTSSTPIPAFTYAGMAYDQSTGLNLTLYRAYAPNIRRWISRDPTGFAGGINQYGYVEGNPADFYDPYGLWSVTIRGYGGLGGGVEFTGTGWHITSVSVMGGIGVGGGVTINPWGSAPDPHAPCGSNSLGGYWEASVGIPGVDLGAGGDSGFDEAVTPGGTPIFSGYGGWDPAFSGGWGGSGRLLHLGDADVEASGSAGIRLTHYF